MIKANDISTLLSVKAWIKNMYYSNEEDLSTRMVLKDIMEDIDCTIEDIMNDMYDDKVDLDD